jgi:predicted TIM-barrel fold metal-dependent hydrolase
MPSRRDALIGAAVAGAAVLARRAASVFATASQATPPAFAVPAGACDCHTHVFGDPGRFPFASPRAYTPGPARVEELRALHRGLRMDRVVIVQPSVYGTDNTCTLDGIRQLGARSRGVAVIDQQTPEATLDEMDRIGVRGIRINLATAGQADPAVARQLFAAAVERVTGRRWHIQIYTQLSVIEAIGKDVTASPVPVVFDHFGGAQAALGTRQAGFEALLDLVRSGKAYVKISAPYRSSIHGPGYPDLVPVARALIAANPQRILWGSDWPHPNSTQAPGRKPTDIAPFHPIDDGAVLNQLAVWAPDAAARQIILVDNPARLYGF